MTRAAFRVINRYRPWHRFSTRISLSNLAGFGQDLRRKNLIDTEQREATPKGRPVPRSVEEHVRTVRTIEGTDNDLSDCLMGTKGAAFGRNMRPVNRPDLVKEPNPVAVGEELLRRHAFLPAKSLNSLAAAWIQFQVRD